MERCRSGRSGRSRKPLYPCGYPGFESLPFRKKRAASIACGFFCESRNENPRVRYRAALWERSGQRIPAFPQKKGCKQCLRLFFVKAGMRTHGFVRRIVIWRIVIFLCLCVNMAQRTKTGCIIGMSQAISIQHLHKVRRSQKMPAGRSLKQLTRRHVIY